MLHYDWKYNYVNEEGSMVQGFKNIDELYDEAENGVAQEVKNDYNSVYETVPVEMIVKKSRFIGLAFHVESDDDVHKIIGDLKKSNKNAKHIAYAYILGETYDVAKNNDDGEPAGSAGAPIFEAIRKGHLTNTLVAVVRFFGGVELGKGKLTRTYNSVALGALNEAKKFKMVYCNMIEIKVSYQNYGAVNKLFSDSNVKIIEQVNDESMPVVKIAVPVKASESLIESIRARTRGAGIVSKYGTGFYKFEYNQVITEQVVPKITKIEQQKNKRRVNIFVDNAFFCGMLKETVIKKSLKVGVEVDEKNLLQSMLESDTQSAFEKATDYLGGRMQTAKELYDKLIKKGYEKEAVEGAISKLKEYKYIDDEEYVNEFVRQNSQLSKKMLESKLFSKGVDKGTVTRCLAALDDDGELSACKKQVEKYLKCHDISSGKGKEKMIASLLRRGFSFGVIKQACHAYNSELEDENIDYFNE